MIQKNEQQFDRLRGDGNARVKLVKLSDEISKLHQEFGALIKERDRAASIPPEDLELKIGESVYAEWNSRGAWYHGFNQCSAE